MTLKQIRHNLVLLLLLGIFLEVSPARCAEEEKPQPSQAAKREKKKGASRNVRAARKWLSKIGQMAEPGVYERQHKTITTAFRSVVAPASKSIVAVYGDGKQRALGTVVDAKGFVLTKASELQGKIECRTADGRRLAAKIVGLHSQHDLAMLKVDADNFSPIQWGSSSSLGVGSWLATPGLEETPLSIGVVSVVPRKIPAPRGILGVLLEEDDNGGRINQVLADSGAEKAGLRVNDVITGVNGKAIANRNALMKFIARFQPGDKLNLAVKRGEEKLDVTAVLGTFQPDQNRRDFQNNLGAKLSKRRTGFPSVLQHDGAIHPNVCGGPIVDLDGKAVGINIARAGRVPSYAIPASVVKPLLADLMSGKLAPPKKEEKKMASTK